MQESEISVETGPEVDEVKEQDYLGGAGEGTCLFNIQGAQDSAAVFHWQTHLGSEGVIVKASK